MSGLFVFLCAGFADSKEFHGMFVNRRELFCLFQNTFDDLLSFTFFKIFDEAARDADEVMVIVFITSEFVIDVAVAEIHLTNDAGFEERLDNSINSCLIRNLIVDAVTNFLGADRMNDSF